MTDEIRNDEVETSTDEVVNEIVEETLEEAEAMSSVKAKGSAKDASPVSEPESIASVDKAKVCKAKRRQRRNKSRYD